MRFRTTRALRQLTTLAALAVASAAIAGALPASAATIWRCGNSYSDRPCGNGSIVDADDARSEAQRRDALRGAQDNAAAAQHLERERRRAEAAQPAPVLIEAPAKPAVKPAKSKKPKRAEPDRFIATDPASVAKRSSKAASKK